MVSRGRRGPALALGLAMVLGVSSVGAIPAPDAWVDVARAVPVAAEGRILPLETWAQVVYGRISGRQQDPEALRWLLTLLARPETLEDQPLILVNNPDALAGLATGIAERGRYSPRQLSAAFAVAGQWAADAGAETAPGRERQRLAQMLLVYQGLAATFDPTSVVSITSPFRCLTLDATPRNPTEVLVAKEGPAPGIKASDWNQLALLVYWRAESAAGHWDDAARAMALMATDRLSLEVWYHHVPWLALVVGLSVLGLGLGWRRLGVPDVPRAIPVVAAGLVATAWIAVRVVLSGRPPVTDLPTTFLFVGWLVLVLAAVLALRRSPSPLGRTLTLVSAVLLVLSSVLEGGSDPFSPLPAVLNTNLWLTFHVTIIVAGYTATLVAALTGHLYLAAAGSKRPGVNLLPMWSTLRLALVVGLGLTVTGTLLGGIWADQSWGRFWGWDPKENGALLVIVWLALTLHLRPSGLTAEWGTAVAAALALPILLVSWLGVNLLAGLHSYGAAPGKALLFAGLLAVDTVALTVLILRRVLR